MSGASNSFRMKHKNVAKRAGFEREGSGHLADNER